MCTVKTTRQAIKYMQWATKYLAPFPANECLMRVREAYGIGLAYPDAKQAYAHTKHKFTGIWVPGAFAWWSTDTHWHVAICAFRKGYVWSTDQRIDKVTGKLVSGHYDRVPIGQIHEKWGANFVGFSLDVNNETPVRLPAFIRSFP